MPTRRSRSKALVAAVLFGLLQLTFVLLPSLTRAEWTPPEPEKSEWDWARIDSGEWLKGELVVVQSKKMTFDSDEFDEVEFDWEDVLDLRLARPRVFRLTENRIYSGTGELRDGVVRITTGEGEVLEIPAKEIVSITYTDEFRLSRWSVKVGANLAARQGNTDQQDFGANGLFQRHATYTRWESRYNGAFGKVDGKETTNNHRASTQLDVMITNHFYVRVPYFEFYLDKFQNIDARYTTGAGVGYEPIDTPMVSYRITLGAAGQVTNFAGGTRSSDAAAILNSELSLDLPRDVDFDLRYALQLLVTDIGRTAHSTSAILSFEIWEPIDLDIGLYWDRIEQPERDDAGNRPKSDDLRSTVGLSVEF
jgi:hypothetical protein